MRAAIDRILTTVADAFGIPESCVRHTTPAANANGARQLTYLIAREVTGANSVELGRAFEREPKVIRVGCAAATRAIERDPVVRLAFETIMRSKLELAALAELERINTQMLALRARADAIAEQLGLSGAQAEAAE